MRKLFVPIVCCLCLTSPLSADDGLSPKTLAAIKRATVFIEVEVEGLSTGGSGFVVLVDGDSALIVTNHHVVEPKIISQAQKDSKVVLAARPPTRIIRPPMVAPIPRPQFRALPPEFTPRLIVRRLKNAAVTVFFDSGTKDERSAKAELLAIDPGYDLAVMRVKDIKNLPEPIKFEKAVELAETMAVYTFGFPFGKMLATGKRRPAMTVTKAAISSLREDDNGELAVVQIDGGVDPGNSGGPVVNADGELVGVAVATIRGSSGIGLAIPAGPLRNMFEGRIGAVHLALKPNSEQPALAIEVSVIDPLNKITAVELHSIEISRVKADLDKGIESLEALPGIEKTKLTLEKQLASGELALASASSDKEYLVQAVYTTANGKPRKTRVFRQSLQTPAVAGVNPNPKGPLPPSEFVDRAPEKGLLIGFEIGLGQFLDVDVVTAIRPIYRADKKEVLGKQYGTILNEAVAVKAKEGYAVGGMTVRSGLFINGFSLTFMRVQDGKLDPKGSYESDWTGDKTGGSEKPRQGDGAPVVGIAGGTDDKYFNQLQLVFEKSTDVATTAADRNPDTPKSGGSAGKSGDAAGGNASGRGDAGEATKILGGAGKPFFKDQSPNDGLLVGFEIGLGPAFGVELVKAIRPIYRTGDEETLGKQYGTAPKNAVVVKAKEGYAVGGMTVRSGLVVNGLSVTFMRVVAGKLNPSDSYQSDWVGDRTGGSETTLKGGGKSVIGIVGNASDTECTGIGLLLERK